jgi:hypothetical protein
MCTGELDESVSSACLVVGRHPLLSISPALRFKVTVLFLADWRIHRRGQGPDWGPPVSGAEVPRLGQTNNGLVH